MNPVHSTGSAGSPQAGSGQALRRSSGQVRIGLRGLLTVLAIAALIGVMSWAGNRERAQQRELNTVRLQLAASQDAVARLSATCAPAQAGEQLFATVVQPNAGGVKCLYTRQSVYGRAVHARKPS